MPKCQTFLLQLLCWALLTTSAYANNASLIDSQPDFLPVHEAYRLNVFVQKDELLLNWEIADGYFLYGDQFQLNLTQQGAPLRITVQQDAGEIAYDDYFEKEVEKFHHFTAQTIPLPDNANNELILSARFQGCAEAGLCYPPETLYYQIDRNKLSATPTEATPLDQHADQPRQSSTPPSSSFALMFAFALLGGLILNLMPCVFPVLSIKLLSFVKSNKSDSHLKQHSWFYTFGVLTTFLATALVLILLRQSGAVIGWGFQLQSPVFIGFLAALFLILGLSLSDVINLGTRFMGVGEQLTHGHHYRNSFFTGVLAVIVASPCSVPFMGVALGYALTQPTYAALVIFFGLGLGLASPFLIFAYVPQLIQHLPKPGPWMQTLKHWFALPLYLSTVWLLWVLWQQIGAPSQAQQSQHQPWKPYSAETLQTHLNKNEKVFIELTADWCITCLVNEKLALTRPAVLSAMKENNIFYLRGDWTNKDPAITALLQQHQRGGVPLYIFYNEHQEATILPQLLTESIVLKVFTRQ